MQDSVDHYKNLSCRKARLTFSKGFNGKFGKYTLLSSKVTGMTILSTMRLSVSQIMVH